MFMGLERKKPEEYDWAEITQNVHLVPPALSVEVFWEWETLLETSWTGHYLDQISSRSGQRSNNPIPMGDKMMGGKRDIQK